MANNLQINVNVGGNALSQLQAVEQRIKKTDTAVKTATGGFNKFGTSAANTTRSVRKFSSAGVQQAGFQVGDLAVQLQNGTHFLTAFGQQGSQLAGVFGATGAVFGAFIAIAAAVGTVILKSTGAVREFSDEVSDLNSLNSELILDNKTVRDGIEELIKKYNEFTPVVQGLALAERQLLKIRLQDRLLKTSTAFEDLSEKAREGTITFTQFLAKIALMGAPGTTEQVDLLSNRFVAVSEKIGITIDEAKKLSEILKLAKLSEGDDRVKNLTNAVNILLNTQKGLTEQGIKLATSVFEYSEAYKVANETIAKIQKPLVVTGERTASLSEIFVENFASVIPQAAEGATSAIKDALTGAGNAMENFKNLSKTIIDAILQQFIRLAIVNPILNSIFGGTPGFGGGEKNLLPTLFPKKAIGGSVQRGRPVIVGERGAEVFFPSSSGSIVANKNMQGGGVTVNQTINVTTGVQQTVRTEIANLMPQIAEATKSAVADARLRGGSYSKAFGR